VWGLRELRSRKKQATVGVLGCATVLLSALFPLALVSRARAVDSTVGAAGYLLSLPMILFFALRVLSGKTDAPV
jgi:hypothetical protein